jgi:hypothetical protein
LNALHVYWEPQDWSLKKEKEGNWKLEKFEESLKKKKEGRKEGRKREDIFFE